MKHDVKATANAAAATITIIYLVCISAIGLFPGLSMTVAQSWFHGLDISKIAVPLNISIGTFILGFVTAVIGGWLIGYIYAKSYNYFSKK